MPFIDCTVARIIALCLIGFGIPIFIILLFLPAWYGRYTATIHYRLGSLSAKAAWLLQECPSFIIPFVYLLCNIKNIKVFWVNGICLCFYLFHYFYRYHLDSTATLDHSFIHFEFVMENAHQPRSG